MNISVNVEIPRELPIKELDRYTDLVVYNVARITLDYTNSKQRFPYLTGELNRASMAEGVVSEGNKTYHLGASGVDYAPDVWEYPQKTNWTNPNTYAQWYLTEYQNEKEIITNLAVNNAMKLVK
jgi:hypothetical protein